MGVFIVWGLSFYFRPTTRTITKTVVVEKSIYTEVEECRNRGGTFHIYEDVELFGENKGKKYIKILCEGSPIIYQKKIN